MLELRDWDQKSEALIQIFSVDAFSGLIDAVLEEDDLDLEEKSKLNDSMYKWKLKPSVKTKTTSATAFFVRLCQKLKLSSQIDERILMGSTYVEFLQMLSDDQRKDAMNPTEFLASLGAGKPPASVRDTTPLSHRLDAIALHRFEMVCFESGLENQPSVRTDAERGSMDQRLFYLHPDSAEYWESIVTSGTYPTYEKCKYSLDRMLNSEAFGACVTELPPSDVIMLGGGGATSKDVSVINSMLRMGQYTVERPLNYRFLDVSSWMTRRTRYRLARSWRTTDWGHRVNFHIIDGDFMFLNRDAHLEDLRSRDDRALWILTAGTIGNIEEGQFLRSLNGVARRGDLLVVAASIKTEQSDKAKLKKADVHRYLNPEVKSLLRSPLQNLLIHLEDRTPVDDVLDSLHAKFVDGAKAGVTDVEASISFVMVAKIGLREYEVFNHTHYQPDSFNSFFNSRGWRPVHYTAHANERSDFAQFLFEKI